MTELAISLFVYYTFIFIYPAMLLILIIYDWIKGNDFQPFYRMLWPFILLGELLSYLG